MHWDRVDTLAPRTNQRSCYAWYDLRLVGLRTCTIVGTTGYDCFTIRTIFRLVFEIRRPQVSTPSFRGPPFSGGRPLPGTLPGSLPGTLPGSLPEMVTGGRPVSGSFSAATRTSARTTRLFSKATIKWSGHRLDPPNHRPKF